MTRHEHHRPDPAGLLDQLGAESRRRALSRVYLGYAPGGGATTAMLDEARRRGARGTDVVVAAWRVHGDVEGALAGLNRLDPGRAAKASQTLDVDALLVRNPEVACIDDLAAPAVDGRPAIESVPRLLAAGITVLATLHVTSIGSVAKVFGSVIRKRGGAVIEDAALEGIDEFELVDMLPDELLQRLRERAVLSPGELAHALQDELRPQVLQGLREAAFRVIADHGDRQIVRYMQEGGVEAPWQVRGRILLCLPARPGFEDRIRGAQRYAAAQDAKFTVVSVRTRPLSDAEKSVAGAYAALAHQLGGDFAHIHGRRVAPALVEFVRQSFATEVILGHRRRARWRPGDTTSEVIRRLSGVDVHILRAR